VQPAFREVTIPPPSVAFGSPVVIILSGDIEARCADTATAAALINALRETR
jgi:hypothetical protein